jgi:hypothetical protein
VVDIEERALRALEEDIRALPAAIAENVPDRVDERENAIGNRREFVADRGGSNLRLAKASAQRIVMDEQTIDLVSERGRIGQIGHADRTPTDLVLVGRPDALLGRADLRAGRRGAFA